MRQLCSLRMRVTGGRPLRLRHNRSVSLSVLTRKSLWGRAGNRCAFPDCRQELNEESANLPGGVIVGQEAHIVAREVDGPRGTSPLSEQERDLYENLVLLCPRHHKIIDTDVASHTVDSLHKLKDAHEAWVRETLGTSGQATMEQYAAILDRWAERARLDRWEELTDGLANAKGPGMPMWGWDALAATEVWLRAVIWPGKLPDLDRALSNFQRVVADFMAVVEGGQPDAQNDGKWLRLTPPRHPYRDVDWRLFETLRDLVTDLTFEMTRAANHVCDVARDRVDPQFRLVDGRLGVTFMSQTVTFPEYRGSELAALYPGVAGFEVLRADRLPRVGHAAE